MSQRPSARKTRLLTLARRCLPAIYRRQAHVVCPTGTSGTVGLQRRTFRHSHRPRFYELPGCGGSLRQVASATHCRLQPGPPRGITRAYRTLVILGKFIMPATPSRGRQVREAFTGATRRLALTGTRPSAPTPRQVLRAPTRRTRGHPPLARRPPTAMATLSGWRRAPRLFKRLFRADGTAHERRLGSAPG